MSSLLTLRGLHSMISGAVDLTNDTIKVMLLDTSFTPASTYDYVSEISSDELTGTGYVAGYGGSGRKTLASKTFTISEADGTVVFDAADVSWATITAGTAQHAAIIKEVTNDAASPIICFVSFTPRVTAGNTLTVAWSSNGIFRTSAQGSDVADVRVVTYTATGAEGTDFNVTVSPAVSADDYDLFPATAGVTNIPLLDLPNLVDGDRTTSAFRVTTGDTLTAGDELVFLLVE